MSDLEFVFLDIGGVIYDDSVYARALDQALRDLGAEFSDEDFESEYRAARAAQNGSFRKRLSARFLPGVAVSDVESAAARYWSYPPEALLPDVRPCLERLSGRYRLGIAANQPSAVRAAMKRDGLEPYFEVWGVS